jgi:hypothetical protein
LKNLKALTLLLISFLRPERAITTALAEKVEEPEALTLLLISVLEPENAFTIG